MIRAHLLALALALASTACAQQLRYSYAPTTLSSADLAGHAATVIEIPPEAPRGDLRIASLGIAELPMRALFVRFVVRNDSEETWVLDEAEQTLELPEHDSRVLLPAVSPDNTRPPVLTVLPHHVGTADVTFAVGRRDEGDVGAFSVHWVLRTDGRAIGGHADFTRRLEPVTPRPANPFSPPARQVPDSGLPGVASERSN